MNFSQSFRLALKSLMTSKMRALLTMLGIIIGVAAVIVITSLGNGMTQMMNDQFDQLGANLIQVQVWGRGEGSRTIEPDDMYALAEKYPKYIAGVSPYVTTQNAAIRQGSDEYKRTTVYGVSEAFYDPSRNQTITGESLAQGRFLSYIDVERFQNVCIIGDYLNQEMFQGKGLGQNLTIGGVPYKVIGVLAQKADNTEGGGDDVIFLPFGNALRASASPSVNLYLFTSTNKDSSAAAKGVIENRLFKTFQSSDYYMVMSSAEMMDAMNTMMDTMMVVLVAIAAISLLVGGIGIMNIMLVSVTERTREIGIRKSLGGKRRDIRSQFIIEAGTTSAIGGVLGIGLGVLMAQAAGVLVRGLMSSNGGGSFNAVPTVGAIAIAFGVSVAIGIAFGYLPANKAAKLNPIDALRYD